MSADEQDFLELLIASERVEAWLAIVRDFQRGTNESRLQQAVQELAAAVEAKEAYAEEARQAGVVAILTKLLKRTDNVQLLELAANIIAACSGHMATTNKIRTFHYEGTPVVIKEGALGDGVGAKIWTVAHTLCRELARYPAIVEGVDVLEIGSGCGACGILAAKLGASQVYMTDYLDAILSNLRACMHLNTAEASGDGESYSASRGSAAAAGGGEACAAAAAEEDEQEELFDPEDASECSDLDDIFSGGVEGGRGQQEAGKQQQAQQGWDAGSMHVRYLDWVESVAYLQQQQQEAQRAAGEQLAPKQASLSSPSSEPPPRQHSAETQGGISSSAATSKDAGASGTSSSPSIAPGVAFQRRFSVILGTDILYEWPMVEMVANVLKHRLAPGGRALLCCAVREQAMFDAFAARLRALDFRIGVTPVRPKMDDAGILGMERDYEGGFVMVAAEHASAPAVSWHRDDLFCL